MKGKGGFENGIWNYRGVRQRIWGKWVVEICQLCCGVRLWLGIFFSFYEVVLVYDEVVKVMYGEVVRFNFFDILNVFFLIIVVGLVIILLNEFEVCVFEDINVKEEDGGDEYGFVKSFQCVKEEMGVFDLVDIFGYGNEYEVWDFGVDEMFDVDEVMGLLDEINVFG